MKFTLMIVILWALIPQAWSAPPPPAEIPGGVEPKVNLRFFYNAEPWILFSEIGATSQTDQRFLKEFTLGAYYQLMDELKVGAFYRRAYGIRQDEDWISSSGQWLWRDTRNRGEDFWMLDATPRLKLEFLPISNLVAELKARYLQNLFNHHQILLIRPGITYFWLKDDQPFLNFFLQYELHYALNFSNSATSERWIYLGALYRLFESFDLGLVQSLKWETWSDPPAYRAKNGPSYTQTTLTYGLGVLGIIHF